MQQALVYVCMSEAYVQAALLSHPILKNRTFSEMGAEPSWGRPSRGEQWVPCLGQTEAKKKALVALAGQGKSFALFYLRILPELVCLN